MNAMEYLQSHIVKYLCDGQEFKSSDLYFLCDESGLARKSIVVTCSRLAKVGFLKIARTVKNKSGNHLSIYVYEGAELVPVKEEQISKKREEYLTLDKRLKAMESASLNLASVFSNIKPQHNQRGAQ